MSTMASEVAALNMAIALNRAVFSVGQPIAFSLQPWLLLAPQSHER